MFRAAARVRTLLVLMTPTSGCRPPRACGEGIPPSVRSAGRALYLMASPRQSSGRGLRRASRPRPGSDSSKSGCCMSAAAVYGLRRSSSSARRRSIKCPRSAPSRGTRTSLVVLRGCWYGLVLLVVAPSQLRRRPRSDCPPTRPRGPPRRSPVRRGGRQTAVRPRRTSRRPASVAADGSGRDGAD